MIIIWEINCLVMADVILSILGRESVRLNVAIMMVVVILLLSIMMQMEEILFIMSRLKILFVASVGSIFPEV